MSVNAAWTPSGRIYRCPLVRSWVGGADIRHGTKGRDSHEHRTQFTHPTLFSARRGAAGRDRIRRLPSRKPSCRPEGELCQQYDISRSVVRQALQSLAHDNLIETERGRGAFVLELQGADRARSAARSLLESMAKAGFKLTTRVLKQERIKPPAHVAEQIGENDAVFLERLRYADGGFPRGAQLPALLALPDVLQSKELEDVSLYQYLADAIRRGDDRQTGSRLARINEEAIAAQLHVEINSTSCSTGKSLHPEQAGARILLVLGTIRSDRLTIDLHRTY